MEPVINVRLATPQDTIIVSGILQEAARWLAESGMPLWKERELEPPKIAADVGEGLFFIAERLGDAAGVIRFQLEDPVFWPDVPKGEAAFIHRWHSADVMLAPACLLQSFAGRFNGHKA